MRLARLSLVLIVLATTPVLAGLPTVQYEGHAYVELERIAQILGARLDVGTDATRTSIRTPRNVVTFTRNWAQILVDGRPVLLDGPVRIKTGVWLVPESFVTAILPRLTPSPSALPRAATSVTLDELRLRSYPSFTRVVLETSGPVTYRVELTGPKEARIDRKSTRLNSSHITISYAVFCLKKKKQKRHGNTKHMKGRLQDRSEQHEMLR